MTQRGSARQRPETWPFVTLCQGMTWLATGGRGYYSSDTLARVYRRNSGRLPPMLEEDLREASKVVVGLIRDSTPGLAQGRKQRTERADLEPEQEIPATFVRDRGAYAEAASNVIWSDVTDEAREDVWAEGGWPCFRHVTLDGSKLPRLRHPPASAARMKHATEWLAKEMLSGPQACTRDQYKNRCRVELGIGGGQFRWAWENAKVQSGNPNGWGKAGRRRKNRAGS